MGRSGREAVTHHVPRLREELALDAVIVNGDNAAGGFGINADICRTFFNHGVNVITGGDHVWDQKESRSLLAREKRLLRPHNFPESTPGSGSYLLELPGGRSLFVLHLLGQVFHKEHASCPFACAEEMLTHHVLGKNNLTAYSG